MASEKYRAPLQQISKNAKCEMFLPITPNRLQDLIINPSMSVFWDR